jgi:prophage antirepressor-like protein
MTVVPERDLYRLIMRSKLPAAERFEEWVVEVVLPYTPQIAPHRAGMDF